MSAARSDCAGQSGATAELRSAWATIVPIGTTGYQEDRVPRIGLVLGAGAVGGHAFHGGVLAGLEDAVGWDARGADVVVGTSAGAVVGALLRAGFRGSDIAARAVDAPM